MLQPEHLCREGGPGTTVELPPKDAGKVLGHQVGTQRSYHEDRDGIRPRVTQLPLRTDTEKDAPSLFGDQLMREHHHGTGMATSYSRMVQDNEQQRPADNTESIATRIGLILRAVLSIWSAGRILDRSGSWLTAPRLPPHDTMVSPGRLLASTHPCGSCRSRSGLLTGGIPAPDVKG